MEQELDKQGLAEIEKQLTNKKNQIIKDLKKMSRRDNHEADNRTAKFPEYGDKPDENAQEINDYSTTVVAERVLEKNLDDINQALDRIKKGTYGFCKYCGQPIGKKRLMARPTASSCISCKTKLQANG